jgi:hypothetical protein
MTRRKLALAFAAVLIARIVATAVVQHFQKSDNTKDIAKSQQLDTAHVARRDSSARVDSTIHTLTRIGTSALREADRVHRLADTAGQHAVSVRDSLEMWRARDSLHRVEVDSLRARIRSDSLQKVLLAGDRDAWKFHSDTLVTAMDRLRDDLKTSEPQCHILPFVRCPSRKIALVAGIVGGVVGVKYGREILRAVVP